MKHLLKTIFIILMLLLLNTYGLGCINDKDGPNDDDDKKENPRNIGITEIHTYFQIALDLDVEENVTVFIPTLVDSDNNPIEVSEVFSDDNWTMEVINTEHGWALRGIFLPKPKPESQPGPWFSQMFYFNYTFNNTFFSTDETMNVFDRYYRGLPGISMWETDGDDVYIWINCSENSVFFRFRYDRGSFYGEDEGADFISDYNYNGSFDRSAGWNRMRMRRQIIESEPAC